MAGTPFVLTVLPEDDHTMQVATALDPLAAMALINLANDLFITQMITLVTEGEED